MVAAKTASYWVGEGQFSQGPSILQRPICTLSTVHNVGMREVNQSREMLVSELIKQRTAHVQRIGRETTLSNTVCAAG